KMKCQVRTVQGYLKKAPTILQKLLDTPTQKAKHFNNRLDACTTVKRTLCNLLNLQWKSLLWPEFTKKFRDVFGTDLHVLVEANEKQVNSVLRRALAAAKQAKEAGRSEQYFALAFTYASASNKTAGTATSNFKVVEDLVEFWAPGCCTLLPVPIVKQRKPFDTGEVKKFIKV